MCVTAIIGCSRRGIMRSKGWLARRRFDGLAFRKGVEVSSSHQMEVVETIKSFTSGLRSRRRRSREFVIAIAVVEAAYRTLLLVLSQRTASDADASHEAKKDVRLRLGRWLASRLSSSSGRTSCAQRSLRVGRNWDNSRRSLESGPPSISACSDVSEWQARLHGGFSAGLTSSTRSPCPDHAGGLAMIDLAP